MSKDRHRVLIGEARANSKLTTTDVLAIRQRVQAGETQRSVALAFGVTYKNISAIVLGKTWRHLLKAA